jgi:hypothetical protein
MYQRGAVTNSLHTPLCNCKAARPLSRKGFPVPQFESVIQLVANSRLLATAAPHPSQTKGDRPLWPVLTAARALVTGSSGHAFSNGRTGGAGGSRVLLFSFFSLFTDPGDLFRPFHTCSQAESWSFTRSRLTFGLAQDADQVSISRIRTRTIQLKPLAKDTCSWCRTPTFKRASRYAVLPPLPLPRHYDNSSPHEYLAPEHVRRRIRHDR